ncbi:helix-turn-helix domain-containing protein [Streptomyces sp. NPDC048258]|uniref:helix-turn-helix domain-containing protein n=1 Tax=Streptomyces sp. NPDC048258 TaxID=3365527 RepID=UPI003716FCDB
MVDTARADEPAEPDQDTFAARLNRLFETIHPADRGPWTNAEVARAVSVSPTYVGNLRKGTSSNPTLAQMTALADFFGVPVKYFVDDGEGEKVREDLALLSALKGVGARQIALRTVAALDDDALNALVPVLKHLGKAQAGRRMPTGRAGEAAPGDPSPL